MIDRSNIDYFNEHWFIDLFLSEWLMAWWIHELGCKWQNAEIDGLDNWLIDQVMNCWLICLLMHWLIWWIHRWFKEWFDWLINWLRNGLIDCLGCVTRILSPWSPGPTFTSYSLTGNSSSWLGKLFPLPWGNMGGIFPLPWGNMVGDIPPPLGKFGVGGGERFKSLVMSHGNKFFFKKPNF